MRRRNLMACLAAVFAVVLALHCTEQARAAGYWNMPGTHRAADRARVRRRVSCAVDSWSRSVRRLGFGNAGAVALCAVAVLRLRKLWRLRADGRGDEFDGGLCADDGAGASTDAGCCGSGGNARLSNLSRRRLLRMSCVEPRASR